eukprot:4491013-Pleurochrysis_carterae.AAC.1
MGFESDCIDSDAQYGGGEAHNLLRDSVYKPLLEKCAAGYYAAIVASPPCSTFSVARFFASPDALDGGPPPVRDRDHVMGLPNVDPKHERELHDANEL